MGAALRTGPPDPRNETAAPTGIGSGGMVGTKAGRNLQAQDYPTSPPPATAFPILALHVGLPAGEGAA